MALSPWYWVIKKALKAHYRVSVKTGTVYSDRRYGFEKQLRLHNSLGPQPARVKLYVEGFDRFGHTIPVHKLVAFVKWGKAAFRPGIHVRHKDGNNKNSRGSNLALGTPSQNEMDKPRHVRVRVAKMARAAQGVTPRNALYTAAQIQEALKAYDELPKSPSGRIKRGRLLELSLQLNIELTSLSKIGRRRSWVKTLNTTC